MYSLHIVGWQTKKNSKKVPSVTDCAGTELRWELAWRYCYQPAHDAVDRKIVAVVSTFDCRFTETLREIWAQIEQMAEASCGCCCREGWLLPVGRSCRQRSSRDLLSRNS